MKIVIFIIYLLSLSLLFHDSHVPGRPTSAIEFYMVHRTVSSHECTSKCEWV